MALLGTAALAMWWDVGAGRRADFEHWHTHEHFPERLGVPGFLRASRWTAATGGEGVFVMYELAEHAVLGSPAYLARLNAPTPWSARLMPEHRNMVRSPCRVLDSRGCAITRQALTVRLSPAPGCAGALRVALRGVGAQLAAQPGIAGVHLLHHDAPAVGPTTEQAMRPDADRAADWVLVVCGYAPQALQQADATTLDDDALCALGAAGGTQRGLYALSCSATPADMR